MGKNVKYSPQQIPTKVETPTPTDTGISLTLNFYLVTYPLKILKAKAIVFLAFTPVIPYLLINLQTPFGLFLIQAFIMLFVLSCTSAMPIFLKHFPVFRRFTYASIVYALSRTSVSIVISLGLVYLVRYLGHWGKLVMILPVAIGYLLGILHFEKLEKEAGNSPQEISIGIH